MTYCVFVHACVICILTAITILFTAQQSNSRKRFISSCEDSSHIMGRGEHTQASVQKSDSSVQVKWQQTNKAVQTAAELEGEEHYVMVCYHVTMQCATVTCCQSFICVCVCFFIMPHKREWNQDYLCGTDSRLRITL